jgi:uncharacterized protein YndB with AHSA1/START domain
MTDPIETRAVDLSIEVPGTPEEVWAAVATGPGITSWFVPTEVEPRAGGVAVMDFGPYGKESAAVKVYDAPHRFLGEAPSGRDDGSFMATEWLVEARDGGTCIVRLVNSGFGVGAEFDADFDGMTNGWKLFMENLRLHLTYFRGEAGQAILPMATVPGANAEAWTRLCSTLGVAPDLVVGDRFETSGEGVPRLTGEVHHAQQGEAVGNYILVLDGELRGTALLAAEGRGETIMLSVWVYLYGGDPALVEKEITAFMADRFTVATPG